MLWQNLRVLVKIIPQLFLKRHSKSALLLKYFFLTLPMSQLLRLREDYPTNMSLIKRGKTALRKTVIYQRISNLVNKFSNTLEQDR